MKITILILTAIAEFFTLKVWFVCKNFTDIFHLSSVNIPLQLENAIHTEKGTPILLTRLFNNKFITAAIDYFRIYLQFWDVRFGNNWFSLIGYFGILAGFYYIFSNKKKNIYHWLMLIGILLLPCIEIVIEPHIPLQLKSFYLWLPFTLFSLYGISSFLNHGNLKKRLIIIFLLIFLSLWYLIFLDHGISRYCIR